MPAGGAGGFSPYAGGAKDAELKGKASQLRGQAGANFKVGKGKETMEANKWINEAAAYEQNLLFWGSGTVANVAVRGLAVRLGLQGIYQWSPTANITLDQLDVSLMKLWAVASDACSSM